MVGSFFQEMTFFSDVDGVWRAKAGESASDFLPGSCLPFLPLRQKRAKIQKPYLSALP